MNILADKLRIQPKHDEQPTQERSGNPNSKICIIDDYDFVAKKLWDKIGADSSDCFIVNLDSPVILKSVVSLSIHSMVPYVILLSYIS